MKNLNNFLIDIKIILKHQREIVILYLIVFIYCIINVINIIDSPDWIKHKKATINSINEKYNKCFKYAVTVTLNNERVREKPTNS